MLLFAVTASLPQAAAQQNSPQTIWRRLGGSTFDAGLAAPATGAVAAVWFSPDASKLYARTVSGKVWETADYESWSPAANPSPRTAALAAQVGGQDQTRVIESPNGTLYALGANLLKSEDNGRTWTNLTAYNGIPVIGSGQNDLAISPRDPQSLYVANAWGIWASHDGGLTWSGLNENLPNLPITEIQSAGQGVRASLGQIGSIDLAPGATLWEPGAASPDYSALSKTLNATVTAVATAGDTAYAGSSDGRIWFSRDKQATWTLSPNNAGGAIERIFADPAAPNFALIASAGKTRSILRTIDSGGFWDDITGSLTANPAHGIAADRSTGAIYVATDRGVFLSRADLNALGAVSPWTSLNGLPDAPARDVKLAGTRVFAAIEGYGVYAASTPSLTGTLRLVSSADLTERPAAPGALLSVVGGKIQSAASGNMTYPVLASASDESQIQVPFEATGTQVSLTLNRALDSTILTLPLKSVSPAIFLDRDEAPVLMDADSGLILDAKSSLRPNARVQLLATGLGKTTPAWPTAVPAPSENPPAVAADVQAVLGTRTLEVTKATLAPGYVGLYLIEFQIPAILDAGPTELYLSVEGTESNRVRVYLTAEN